jgi:uncharacterized protein (DUF1015 family)
MTVAHPIAQAWITTGSTGARNYDEFADEAEITEIIRANPRSALAVEMPHCAPENVGHSFAASLPDAAARLARAKEEGCFTPATEAVVLYRITDERYRTAPSQVPERDGDGGRTAYGMFCMVDTEQISASPSEPGLVIRNEDVFIEKVHERVALAEATGHLLSPVLLLQTNDALHAALADACDGAGAPAATDVDSAGRTHAIWLLPRGPEQDRLLDLASAGELVVADGNHRSLAAQIGELPRFLAVVTTPDSVTIEPYNRLVSELPTGFDELLNRLAAAGARVAPVAGPPQAPTGPGAVQLYHDGRTYSVRLPPTPGASVVENLDHALVERVLLRDALGLDPGDKRITYVGGDYPAGWLSGEVDAGRAELAILVAPVAVADFVAVNLARLKLPRKSTWFTPKARAGLVLAELIFPPASPAGPPPL